MDRYGTTVSQASGQQASDLQSIMSGFRQSTVRNRERNEVDPVGTAKLRLTPQSKLRNLIVLQQAHDHIDATFLPFIDLRLQPLLSTRTGHNGNPSRCSNLNPM